MLKKKKIDIEKNKQKVEKWVGLINIYIFGNLLVKRLLVLFIIVKHKNRSRKKYSKKKKEENWLS